MAGYYGGSSIVPIKQTAYVNFGSVVNNTYSDSYFISRAYYYSNNIYRVEIIDNVLLNGTSNYVSIIVLAR